MRRTLHPLILSATVLAFAPASARADAQPRPERWVGVGASVVGVGVRRGDHPAGTTFDERAVTFPSLYAGYSFGAWSIEAGYRKLGTYTFRSADGASAGDTHSNALYATAVVPVLALGPVELGFRGGVMAVRTVTEFDRRAPGHPIEGGRNAWQLGPMLGVGLTWAASRNVAVSLTFEGLPGSIGDAKRTGRSEQRWLGLAVQAGF